MCVFNLSSELANLMLQEEIKETDVQVVIFPPHPYLVSVNEKIKSSSNSELNRNSTSLSLPTTKKEVYFL